MMTGGHAGPTEKGASLTCPARGMRGLLKKKKRERERERESGRCICATLRGTGSAAVATAAAAKAPPEGLSMLCAVPGFGNDRLENNCVELQMAACVQFIGTKVTESRSIMP